MAVAIRRRQIVDVMSILADYEEREGRLPGERAAYARRTGSRRPYAPADVPCAATAEGAA
ncbi:hypothetical protein [Streptomyces sp. NPDC040750]|uniref:hypothetical protein n=1 Tax=Streptomyces sp. NPDC040750 TaxID=3154491 RepID=UPI0033C9061D